MKTLIIVLIIYFSGVLAVALRFILFVVLKVDKYHWPYFRKEIISSSIRRAIFWPFNFILLDEFIFPKKHIIRGDKHTRAILDRLNEKPPACSNILIFNSETYDSKYDLDHIEFHFHSKGSEPIKTNSQILVLTDDLIELYIKPFENTPEGKKSYTTKTILKWLNNRDKSDSLPSLIPQVFNNELNEIIVELAEKRKAHIICSMCNEISQFYKVEKVLNKQCNSLTRISCCHEHSILRGRHECLAPMVNGMHFTTEPKVESSKTLSTLYRIAFNIAFHKMFPISGGDGNSIEDAVILLNTGATNNYVGIEYDFINHIAVYDNFTWELVEQKLFHLNDKFYDEISIERRSVIDGKILKDQKKYFFDFTAFANIPISDDSQTKDELLDIIVGRINELSDQNDEIKELVAELKFNYSNFDLDKSIKLFNFLMADKLKVSLEKMYAVHGIPVFSLFQIIAPMLK